MTTQSIQEKLKSQILGKEFSCLLETDSTNARLKTLHERQARPNGFMLIAEKQSQGKGTDGNVWASEKGNIYASILFEHSNKINTLFPLYPAVALAKTLNNYQIEAHVKWPNDVLVGQKKIAGILCEGVSGKYMIMGIGINVNQTTFPNHLSDIATSAKLESGLDFSIEEFLADFLNEYETLFYGKGDIIKEWCHISRMIGKKISISQDGKKKEVEISGLSPEGFLQIISEGKSETLMARRGLDISVNY